MPVIDTGNCSTDPGDASVFAPPIGFDGDEEEYLLLMQSRYRDVEMGQRMFRTAKLSLQNYGALRFTGPFEQQARMIVGKIAQRYKDKQRERREKERSS